MTPDNQIMRFDAHEDARTKKVIGELRSIGDKLDQLVTCLIDISTSLNTLSTLTLVTCDHRDSEVEDKTVVYDLNTPVGVLNENGEFVKMAEDMFDELGRDDFSPKEKEEGRD